MGSRCCIPNRPQFPCPTGIKPCPPKLLSLDQLVEGSPPQ